MRTPVLRRGFTLIELLVVVAIIALLIAILIPSLGRARQKAKNSVCMSNLKAHGTGMFTYATEWNGRLPSDNPASGGGLIMWDVTVEMTDKQLASVGLNGGGSTGGADNYNRVRTVFYCPMAPDANVPTFWNYNTTYRVAGYYFLNDRKNTTLQALVLPKYSKRSTIPQNGTTEDQELVMDVVMDKIATPNSFSNITLGGGGGFTTSHMATATKPEGSNIVYIDGHVDFRAFSKMQVRYTSTKAAPDNFQEWF